ncbi:MAG: imidazole glycerol phosphate synthase subunit HisF [Synergistaceae bacterium]
MNNQKCKIIPCLDIKEGRVVKGIKFVDVKDAGDPVECAKAYQEAGANELVFLDITATNDARKTVTELVSKVASQVTIPFAVGGGISTLEDVEKVLNAGADKISINSAGVKTPQLLKKASEKFGSEKIISAIDVTKTGENKWEVLIAGGQKATGLDLIEWAKEVEKLGVGEILLTSMDKDGTKSGYDIEATKAVAEAVKIPVTASGGAGTYEDFYEAVHTAKASAVLAASLFHFNEISIPKLKEYLREKGIEVE